MNQLWQFDSKSEEEINAEIEENVSNNTKKTRKWYIHTYIYRVNLFKVKMRYFFEIHKWVQSGIRKINRYRMTQKTKILKMNHQ
jgi:hypothetical protein